MQTLFGKDYVLGTSVEYIRSFIQDNYGTDDLDIKRLGYGFVSEYAFWLADTI